VTLVTSNLMHGSSASVMSTPRSHLGFGISTASVSDIVGFLLEKLSVEWVWGGTWA
jgi:hypothetical protein